MKFSQKRGPKASWLKLSSYEVTPLKTTSAGPVIYT